MFLYHNFVFGLQLIWNISMIFVVLQKIQNFMLQHNNYQKFHHWNLSDI